MTAPTEKWTEIEHLPEWDDEYYDAYTAKKFGKWVMFKTLKPEFKDDPKYQAMLEKEFEVRYNLCHPYIIMINDLEEVPGVGLCIIADDFYGDTLQKQLASGTVSRNTLDKVTNQLVDAIEYIQTNHIIHHPINPSRIIFTENIGNLKLADIGFDQKDKLTPAAAAEDINNFGVILGQVLEALKDSDIDPRERARLQHVVRRCTNPERRYKNIQELRNAIQGRTDRRLYVVSIIFLLFMVILLLLTIAFPSLWGK